MLWPPIIKLKQIRQIEIHRQRVNIEIRGMLQLTAHSIVSYARSAIIVLPDLFAIDMYIEQCCLVSV